MIFAKSSKLPKMMGFQAEGAAPIVKGEIIQDPKTIASAIKIGNPASWTGALDARDESGGLIDSVSDDQIINAYIKLTRPEGIFCDPASAASVSGLIDLVDNGLDLSGKTIVCVLTGNGLKDPETSQKNSGFTIQTVDPNPDEILKLLKNQK